MTTERDNVNNPAHYAKHAIECIDIMESFSYPNLANAFKYVWRAGYKDAVEQDLNKARFYVNRHYEWLADGDDVPSNPIIRMLQLKLLDIVKNTMEEERIDALKEILSASHGYSSARACLIDISRLENAIKMSRDNNIRRETT